MAALRHPRNAQNLVTSNLVTNAARTTGETAYTAPLVLQLRHLVPNVGKIIFSITHARAPPGRAEAAYK
jgi:hypothetical protein